MPPVRPGPFLILAMCVVAVLTLNHVVTVGSVLPALIAEWRLTNAEGGWLNGIFFAGFIVAVPWLNSLTDRVDPKRVFLVFSALSAMVSFGFGWLADGFWMGLGLRFMAGVGLAGTYSTGLKALADCFEGAAQARAISYYSSCYSIGTAVSIFLGGTLEAWLGWRWSFLGAGLASTAALLIVLAVLPWRQPAALDPGAGHVLDFRPVLRNRESMTYVLLSLGHIWEMFGNRMWLVAFFTFVFALHGFGDAFGPLKPSDVAALVAICAPPISMMVGELAAGRDRRRFILAIMALSSMIGCLAGFTAPLSIYIVIGVAILYSMAAFADSGILSAGVIQSADPSRRGATMAVHSFIGNFGGLIAPVMVGVTLDFAGETVFGWGLAFMVMALGSAFGLAVLLTRMPRRPNTPA